MASRIPASEHDVLSAACAEFAHPDDSRAILPAWSPGSGTWVGGMTPTALVSDRCRVSNVSTGKRPRPARPALPAPGPKGRGAGGASAGPVARRREPQGEGGCASAVAGGSGRAGPGKGRRGPIDAGRSGGSGHPRGTARNESPLRAVGMRRSAGRQPAAGRSCPEGRSSTGFIGRNGESSFSGVFRSGAEVGRPVPVLERPAPLGVDQAAVTSQASA